MNPRILLACLVGMSALTTASCEERSGQVDTNKNKSESAAASAPVHADNTANNKSDQDAGATTPLDQSEDPADIKITADIRRAIIEDKSMSMNAQNCKIITAHGVVTLRGVVDSEAEKAAVAAWAQKIAGVTRVDNQLEIKTDVTNP